VRHVRGATLWANTHLLFWLSLVPFTTRWMGDTHFAAVPVALYGIVLLGAAVAFTILVRVIIAHHGKHSDLAVAVGEDRKGKASLALYCLAVVLAFFQPLAACLLYAVVALIWLVPDRRIERQLSQSNP
ncbi:MAG: TMEM175 family protein, partial [Gemmatimonadaceae bacterium]